MFENKKIAHALVYDKNDLGIDEEIRKNLKVFYKRNLFIDHIKDNPPSAIIEDSPTGCIISASKQGFDFLIITWEGNIFDIYEFHLNCLNYIIELENQDDWVVAGHIIDQHRNRLLYNKKEAEQFKNSFYLFPITAIVNIKRWEQIGRPHWGDNSYQKTIIKAIPSSESIHDGYTPLQLCSSKEEVSTKVKKGWQIINESLKNDFKVYNLNDSIRRSQNYLYPENDASRYNKFWKHLLDLPKFNDAYEKVFNFVIPSKSPKRIRNNNWSYFLRNTEEYWPLSRSINLPIASEIDCLIVPCSGFKDFITSQSILKVNNKITIIHYDILKPCIDIRKKIINEWDGCRKTLPILLESIKQSYVTSGRENPFHMNAMKSLDDVYNELEPFFDSESSLMNKWMEFQNFEHYYFHLDILNEIDDHISELSEITKEKNVYFCLSDVAAWRMNLLGYRVKNLRLEMLHSITSLVIKKQNSIIDYKDPATDLQHIHTFDDALNTLSSDYEI